MGLLVVAMGLTFTFDDAAAVTTGAVPSRLWLRRLLRLGLGIVPWVALIGLLLWAGAQELTVESRGFDGDEPEIVILPPIPPERMALEAAGIAALALAMTGLIARKWDEQPGKFASPGMVALFAASWIVPDHLRPWVDPYGETWLRMRPWWWGALIGALIVATVLSWDTRTR